MATFNSIGLQGQEIWLFENERWLSPPFPLSFPIPPPYSSFLSFSLSCFLFLSLFPFYIPCPVGGYMERSGRYVFGPSPLVLCFPATVPLFRLCLSAGVLPSAFVGFRRNSGRLSSVFVIRLGISVFLIGVCSSGLHGRPASGKIMSALVTECQSAAF